MKDRSLWVFAAVVVGLAVVVLYLHRTGTLPNPDSSEGVALLGSPGGVTGNVPVGWTRPPPIGSDPSYRGPEPSAPMRFSPYAMETSKRVKRRDLPRDNDDPGMARAIAAAAEGVDGRIAYLGDELDDRFEPLGDRVERVDAATFETDDAEAVATQLAGRGFAFVLASARTPRPGPWMQEDLHQIRARLRDGLPLSHFHPVVFGRAHVLYRIAAPMEFSRDEREKMVSWARRRLVGDDPGPLAIARPVDSVGRDEHRVILSLRSRQSEKMMGRRVLSVSAPGETLEQALAGAVDQVRASWPEARAMATDRYRETFPQDLVAAMARMEVELEVVDRMCRIVDRDVQRLVWQFEMGLEGMYLESRNRFNYLSPATPIQEAFGDDFSGERNMLELFLERHELGEDAWDRRASTPGPFGQYANDFGRFETHHWLERQPGGGVVELYRGVPLVTIADVTRDAIVRGLQFGAQWLVTNQLDDGQFRYRYKPLEVRPSRRWINGNNVVRHALNPYTLLLVNRVAPDERLVESARRGLAYTLEHLRHGRTASGAERCYVWHRDVPAPYENAKLGTVAVTILSILAMADVMDISEYEATLSCLAEELLYVQDPNGHFRQYDVPEDHDYYGCENTIFPGELMLALARVYTRTHDRRFKDAFDRAFQWYTAWWALNVDNTTRDGIYNEEDRMNLVGFVPWVVMALNEMHSQHAETRYVDFAFQIQDWMDDTFFFDAERTPYVDYLGSYFKHHWEQPAINSNGYTEGAAAAYAMALRTGRDVERRRQVLLLGVRFALQIQYAGYDTTYFIPDPQTAMGGFRYNLNGSRSRNDYSYHAMSALSQAVTFLRPQDYPAVTPIPMPRTLAGVLGEAPAAGPQPAADAAPPDGGP